MKLWQESIPEESTPKVSFLKFDIWEDIIRKCDKVPIAKGAFCD